MWSRPGNLKHSGSRITQPWVHIVCHLSNKVTFFCRLWQCVICARNSTTTATRLQPPHRLMLISVGGWRATASVGRRAKWSGPKQDEEEGKTIIKASRHVLTFISKRLSDSRLWTPPATSARFKQPSRKKCTLQSMHYDVKMISEHWIGANYKLQANYIAHCTNQVTCIILPEVPYWWWLLYALSYSFFSFRSGIRYRLEDHLWYSGLPSFPSLVSRASSVVGHDPGEKTCAKLCDNLLGNFTHLMTPKIEYLICNLIIFVFLAFRQTHAT